MVGFRAPGDSVVPHWLQDEARTHSQALYKQQLRARAGKGKGRGADAGDAKGKGKGPGRGAGPKGKPPGA
eukprot:2540918-Lingulodinium_polyedra.AAC.1